MADPETYPAPKELAMHLTLKDVWLDYSMAKQQFISRLVSGDELKLTSDGCLDPNGQYVLKFSKQFINEIESLKTRNYEPRKARVNFIVFWKKEGTEQEFRIVLPELCFEKA